MPRSGGIRIEDHFPGGIKLDDPLTVLAAFEAFIGLLIEVTFIATFTRASLGNDDQDGRLLKWRMIFYIQYPGEINACTVLENDELVA